MTGRKAILKSTGKEYSITFQETINAERESAIRVKTGYSKAESTWGKTFVYGRAINAKTGKPWQGIRTFEISEVEFIN